MAENLKKGQILVVKVPPFFDHEYFYEVIAAGGKMIRVSLHKSARVKKHWTLEEYALLVEHGMVRPANQADLQKLAAQEAEAEAEKNQDPALEPVPELAHNMDLGPELDILDED